MLGEYSDLWYEINYGNDGCDGFAPNFPLIRDETEPNCESYLIFITRYFTYSTPPKNLQKTKGILLMNKNEDDFDEIFNKLADLFYYISEVILNFNINN